jgi:hypothetical protein
MPELPNQPEEPDLTPGEIAAAKKIHVQTVIRLFIDEPGVIRLGHGPRHGKRQYYTLRIPKHVAERVFNRLRVKGAA